MSKPRKYGITQCLYLHHAVGSIAHTAEPRNDYENTKGQLENQIKLSKNNAHVYIFLYKLFAHTVLTLTHSLAL